MLLLIKIFLNIGIVSILFIIYIAYLVLLERKLLALMQLREGPNTVGIFGSLQPIADAIKVLSKEFIWPKNCRRIAFLASPMITFVLAIMNWAIIPFCCYTSTKHISALVNIDLGLLYFLVFSGLGIYGIVISGWASNSVYPLLGGIRSVAQMISYELTLGTVIVLATIIYGTANLSDMVAASTSLNLWKKIALIPIGIIFFITILAETNRHPFDLPEAESELVGGYNTEYSSMPFALFFLGEYANMIIMSSMLVIMFMGGWNPIFNLDILNIIPGFIWFFFKINFILFLFIWVRASVPRFRYDQLIKFGWKTLLPITFGYFVLIMIAIFIFDR